MRGYSTATSTHLSAREGTVARTLIWVKALNRSTNAVETMGLWNGDDHQSFVIGGEERIYYGAGSVMEVEPITMQVGLVVRMQRLVLSHVTPEVAQLIRGYEPRHAPVEIHRALFDPDTYTLIDVPHLIHRGSIDEAPISDGELGGESRCEIALAGPVRALTRTLTLKKSDSTQRLRSGDRFRRYNDVSGEVPVWWGEKRSGQKTKKNKIDLSNWRGSDN